MTINELNLRARLIITVSVLMFFNMCSSAAESQPATNSEGYNYNSQVVELQGVAKKLKAYGPPGYGEGENPKDDVEDFYILKLNKPININRDAANYDATESNVSEIQLVIIWTEQKKIFGTEKHPNLANEKILVRGTLYHSFNAHHHRKVLMVVEKIGLLNKDFFHSIYVNLLNFYESIFQKPPIE